MYTYLPAVTYPAQGAFDSAGPIAHYSRLRHADQLRAFGPVSVRCQAGGPALQEAAHRPNQAGCKLRLSIACQGWTPMTLVKPTWVQHLEESTAARSGAQ